MADSRNNKARRAGPGLGNPTGEFGVHIADPHFVTGL
jgi:hypothetical protein